MKQTVAKLFLMITLAASTVLAKPWKSEIPGEAADALKWQTLVQELTREELYFGAVAASARMLLFFSDLPTKELAYKTVIDLIDKGYPFSTRHIFITGDLTPAYRDNFSNSYNIYKGITNAQKGMTKWADHYFDKIDKESFHKYLFYQAIGLYGEKKLDEALLKLEAILKMDLPEDQTSFAKKVARTMARIFFEKQEYAKSYDIYKEFLLRTNPLNPGDWLEAAWNAYYLKRFPETLGLLYNLESKSVDPQIQPEKYVLRALIYREYCATEYMNELREHFQKDFGATIKAVESGEPLVRLTGLDQVYHPDNVEYAALLFKADRLRLEEKLVNKLPNAVIPLAQYLYKTELRVVERETDMLREKALQRAARKLIVLSESLRFLKFDVAREKFNPDKVFQKPATAALIEDLPTNEFLVRWLQYGDYWRDERLKYKGIIKDQCGE